MSNWVALLMEMVLGLVWLALSRLSTSPTVPLAPEIYTPFLAEVASSKVSLPYWSAVILMQLSADCVVPLEKVMS